MRIDQGHKRRLGVSMMLSAMILSVLAFAGAPAGAEEAPERQSQEITDEMHATYYAPRGDAAPNTLVSEFPPGVICVVEPRFCPDSAEPVFQPVEDGVTGAMDAEEENQPEQPGDGAARPDTLPVSATSGKPDYRSVFTMDLPEVPADHDVTDFTLYLKVEQPSYTQDNPGFRQAVLAAFTCIRGCQQDQFDKIPESAQAETDLMDLEICPVRAGDTWSATRGQPASLIPAVDCITGSNGKYADGNVEVSFDLTLFLSNFSGDFNGFLIRPANLENLAYGDPDTSYNAMVSMLRTVEYTIATEEQPEEACFFDCPGDDTGTDDSFDDVTTDPSEEPSDVLSGGVGTPPSTGGGFAPPPSTPVSAPDQGAPAPEVAGPGGGGEQPQTPVVAQPPLQPANAPGSAWYVWLLVPVFGAGMFLTAQSLTAAPVLAEATARSGAMTRLLEKRAASDLGGPEFVRF